MRNFLNLFKFEICLICRKLIPLKEIGSILFQMSPRKQQFIIQNISQLYDILMDAVDEVNSHFSIQVFLQGLTIKFLF